MMVATVVRQSSWWLSLLKLLPPHHHHHHRVIRHHRCHPMIELRHQRAKVLRNHPNCSCSRYSHRANAGTVSLFSAIRDDHRSCCQSRSCYCCSRLFLALLFSNGRPPPLAFDWNMTSEGFVQREQYGCAPVQCTGHSADNKSGASVAVVAVVAVRKCPYQNSYFPSNDVADVAVAVLAGGENEVDRSDGDGVRIYSISIGQYSVHRDTWERTARVLTSCFFLFAHTQVCYCVSRIGISISIRVDDGVSEIGLQMQSDMIGQGCFACNFPFQNE